MIQSRAAVVRSLVLPLAAAFSFAIVAPATFAQSTQTHSAPQTAHRAGSAQNDNAYAPESTASHNWTTDQIITATVHQAWVLSGKDENNFFEIVKELAEISARNRNVVLPDDPAAGRRAGAYIKAQAKADHNQLLYAIVDKSVRMTGKPAPAVASTR